MEANLVVPLIGILCALLLLVGIGAFAIRIVPENSVLVLFRLGRYEGTRGPGLTVLLPLLDRGVWVNLREQPKTIHSVELLLRNRETVHVDVDYTFRVVDPVASVMNVAHPTEALYQLVSTTLQTLAANQTRVDLWVNRESTENEIISQTRETLANWGIELMRVSLREVSKELSTVV